MDAAWGAETTSRASLTIAFVAGNLVESCLMAAGAMRLGMAPAVFLTPLMLGAMMLPVAHLTGGADVFAGTLLVVLGMNALLFAGAFAQGAAVAVDEMVLSSQTLALWCVLATVVMPLGWDASGFMRMSAHHPWATALLVAGTLWTLAYLALHPRVPAPAALLTADWAALCVVVCCLAALHASDFTCLWPGPPLHESLRRSFAAGMVLFYLMFHLALVVVPFGAFLSKTEEEFDYFYGFAQMLAHKLVAPDFPRWLLVPCLALQAGTWALIYSQSLMRPSTLVLFVALGFAHVYLIVLKSLLGARTKTKKETARAQIPVLPELKP